MLNDAKQHAIRAYGAMKGPPASPLRPIDRRQWLKDSRGAISEYAAFVEKMVVLATRYGASASPFTGF
jgi:hypothetical protein